MKVFVVREDSLQRLKGAAIGSGLKAVLGLACLLGPVVVARTQSGAAQSGPAYGRHFIVLIDESGSMAGRSPTGSVDRRPAITADLPGQLFGGIKGIRAFNPARDRVSVLFFTILKSPKACDERKPQSALPENIFDLAYTGRLQGEDDFAKKLAGWMSRDCRFDGNLSPIALSSLLVLPYLQPKLPADELHTQTILIQVTDAKFNSQPGHELAAYRQSGLDDMATTDQLLSRVSRFFTLNILPDQESIRGVFYLAATYSPQRPPESAIQYQRNSFLYPQALSRGELRYRLNDQSPGDIQLLSQGKGAEFDFKPLWVRVGFQDEQGRDWHVGGQTLPRLTDETEPVSLNPCERPVCESSKDNDRLGVGLFEAGTGGPLKVPPSAADPGPGQIKFSVSFHYQTPIYSHLSVETPELLVMADPARRAEIPNLFLPPSRLSNADIAAEWERDDDGVTTQEEAKNRILARREVHWLLLAFTLVLLAALTMVLLFLRYYHRRFSPRLRWLAAPEVVVDFNRPAASRVLVGTLKVENDQPVPWLGRLLRNEEQPTRAAEISLEYNYFRQSGLDLAGGRPIGFLRGEKADAEGDALDCTTSEAVSDGKQIPVFLAAENIQDYRGAGAATDSNGPGARFDVPLKAEMSWDTPHTAAARAGSVTGRVLRRLRGRLASKRPGHFAEKIECRLTVKPEEPRKPRVTYTPSDKPRLYFKKGARVQVGSFWFESQALHEFAQPYRWEGYAVQTYQGDRPLSGEPIHMAQAEVEVPSGKKIEVPVYIYCDGQTIPNPAPVSREYSFRLIGDFDSAESEPGPYTTTLCRDPTRADIALRLLQPRRRLEVYWTPGGEVKLRTLPDGAPAEGLLDGPDLVVLESQTIKFDVGNAGVRELLSFEIGNSGMSGEGTVEVEMTTGLRCSQAVRNAIQPTEGHTLDDLLGVYDVRAARPAAMIKEGEPPQKRSLYLRPAVISRIVSARIEAHKLAAEVRLDVRVVNDRKEVTRRTLTVVVPINLEQLPGPNWLAIDFGTSAISAALGHGDSVMMIPLQNVAVEGGRSFAQHDTENAERDNPYLLPSWICCNAELRNPSGDRSRPGFPGYYSPDPSMTPGEPDFIGLPAVTHEFEEHPGRIIYSLKSWLGKISPNIPIHVKENGREVQKMLPLEKMVESGFAALAEAYLLPDPAYRADQIIITYPNTFTQRHQDLLRRVAYRALGKPTRFRIPLEERVRLISESDAVAYYYCAEQMNGQPRAGTERLLVYDFGAGTLDLSLITVGWKQDAPRYPLEWKVEKRLGVPVAGNYIDELLARIIHDLLSDPQLVESKGFKYRRKVVGLSLDKDDPVDHRRAVILLWGWIRESKHRWSDACRAVLDNGGSLADCPPLKVKVGSDPGVVGYASGGQIGVPRAGVDESKDEPTLYAEDSRDIYLSIPARLIAGHERMTQFMNFVTGDVIEEVLGGAGVAAEEVDTVIVSGRGARFPKLRERVWSRFPNAAQPDLLEDDAMKSAVVRGAIARQDLSLNFTEVSAAAALAPRLALLTKGNDLIPEKDWDKPIDLTASPTFRLVQTNLKNPDPRKDMKSLRKHFYIDLTDRDLTRDNYLGDDKHLCIRKEVKDGELAIYLCGADGGSPAPVFTEGQIAKTVTNPPWPVGNELLHPQE
jgi:hypothetical protein